MTQVQVHNESAERDMMYVQNRAEEAEAPKRREQGRPSVNARVDRASRVCDTRYGGGNSVEGKPHKTWRCLKQRCCRRFYLFYDYDMDMKQTSDRATAFIAGP